MKIELTQLSKKYNKSKVFNNLSYTFTHNNSYAILGLNGSGKSTLLNILAGNLQQSTGEISYYNHSTLIPINNLYKSVAIVAPYLDLFDNLTLTESIELQAKFKPFKSSLNTSEIIELLNLENNSNKMLKDFSSGMKQRVKLGLAILSDTSFLFLDEPTMNLDAKNIDWYQKTLEENKENRLIIVASNNQKDEFYFCNKTINIEDYK